MPASSFRCTSEAGRVIEQQLLRNVRNHELIDDDKVIPDTFDIGWCVDIDDMGVSIDRDSDKNAEGVETGHRFHYPIKDLKRDFHLLKPADCKVDRPRTLAYKGFLEDLFGGCLPVEIRSGVFNLTMLTLWVVELMGMEAFFIAMYESPDELHQLMAYLRDNALRVRRWYEAEGLPPM